LRRVHEFNCRLIRKRALGEEKDPHLGLGRHKRAQLLRDGLGVVRVRALQENVLILKTTRTQR
jgi:hypothetical protein